MDRARGLAFWALAGLCDVYTYTAAIALCIHQQAGLGLGQGLWIGCEA